jgi:phosphoadenosine phosphosulfate reductase
MVSLQPTAVQVAIDRIRAHCPPEGYWLAFSGGKDSTVVYALAQMAGVAYDVHYQVTGIDPPELVEHIRDHYPGVKFERHERSIWRWIETSGLPTCINRWCCRALKEGGGAGRTVLTGVRWAESSRRRQRRMVEPCYRDDRRLFVHPIIDWSDTQVWQFIRSHHLPYCQLYDEGFRRLGCVMCPCSSRSDTARGARRWPKIAEAWRRAAYRAWARQTPGMQKFETAEDYWQWWLSRKSRVEFEAQKAQLALFGDG